jgi:hypothetical protein
MEVVMAVNIEELKAAIVELIKTTHGKKNLKPMDVTKDMIAKFGEGNCDKGDVKKALRELVDTGVLTYKYAGGSYVTLPEK